MRVTRRLPEAIIRFVSNLALPRKVTLSEEGMMTLTKDYITFYNNERFQKKIDQLSPIEYWEKLAA